LSDRLKNKKWTYIPPKDSATYQNWIANAILVEETKNEKAYIDMGLTLYPTPKFIVDDFA